LFSNSSSGVAITAGNDHINTNNNNIKHTQPTVNQLRITIQGGVGI
jgi:hypothetical protein